MTLVGYFEYSPIALSPSVLPTEFETIGSAVLIQLMVVTDTQTQTDGASENKKNGMRVIMDQAAFATRLLEANLLCKRSARK